MPRVAALSQIVSYADEHLRIREIDDWPNALNGLQVENSGAVTKIGAAVDASPRSINAAIERGVNLLVVHHGLFWPGLQPISGGRRGMLEQIFRNDLALYSAHLPLDLHSVLGNNAQLAASLGFEQTEPFFEVKGQRIGLRVATQISREELATRLEQSLGGPIRTFATGPAETKSIGLITGGAGSEIYAVAREGIDTFVTGEAPHWAAVAAEEIGINLLLGGHYATETFGVKALAAHLSERFNLPWEFIDSPTGL
ncbi:MAG TPA: Nif3-like dinuclear metal center hexameric protein [Chthoniobacterales bacterium]|nr:Nif3-like dinuclear metal center hexameric protein [Chthoniobacterales bacterium]